MTISADYRRRYKELGQRARLIRQGKATPTDIAEYEYLDAQFEEEFKAAQRAPEVRTIMDLPIARLMWEADAREVERS